MKRITALAVLLAIVLSILVPFAGAVAEDRNPPPPPKEEEAAPSFRLDTLASEEETPPGNLRLLIGDPGENYTFRDITREGFPEDYQPDMTGLSALNISGSAQYSVGQFRFLAKKIAGLAPDIKNVYIVDLRQESHGFVYDDNEPDYFGVPLSWHAKHNWANLGMSTEEVLAEEKKLFRELVGTSVTLKGKARKNGDRHNKVIQISSAITEEELVRMVNDEIPGIEFHYVRFAIPDRTFPEEEIVDAFMQFIKGIDMNSSWLHFHCQAGIGRTAIMMSIYDMMKNPEVEMTDILVRHTMTGGAYPLSAGQGDEALKEYDEKRIRLVPLVYDYIHESREANDEILWSEWLKRH